MMHLHNELVPVKRGTLGVSFLPVVRAAVLLSLILTLSQVPAAATALPTSNSLELYPEYKAEPWNSLTSSSEEIEEDADFISVMQKIIAGIVTFVIVVVVVCLVLCFCCPICIFAKMRRRRGVVVRTGPGVTATSNGNNVVVTVNRSAPPPAPVATSPQVVAISNNLNAHTKPYPVQESVTVVPLLQPQLPVQYPPTSQHHHQPMNIGYPPGPAFPQNFELPPPYPGLARDSDTTNLPYNPYFMAENESPSAPPPK